jgi:superoxide dismutase
MKASGGGLPTRNQDNSLMDMAEEKGTLLLVKDVLEHAYYLKYKIRDPITWMLSGMLQTGQK